jgi:serine protease inhibitor
VRQQTIFRADHAFAFFIRDTTSGVILFEGRLLQPKS